MPPNLESLYLNFNSRLEMDMQDIDEHTREFGMDITNRIHATTLETTKSSIWSHSESVNKPQKEEIPFIDQIMEYLKETDVKYIPDKDYMFVVQEDITEKMRSILIDWLIDVHLKFKLEENTLHITVNIIDRFLSNQKINRKKLQLIGVSCMLIACKFEEIYAPEVRDFVYISDDVNPLR